MAVAAALAVSSAAWAQGAAATDQSAPAAGQTPAADQTIGQLQEVVVTAERRAENVQTTPIAVNAISGSALLEAHAIRWKTYRTWRRSG